MDLFVPGKSTNPRGDEWCDSSRLAVAIPKLSRYIYFQPCQAKNYLYPLSPELYSLPAQLTSAPVLYPERPNVRCHG